MPDFTIPDRDLARLKIFVALTDANTAALVLALQAAPPALHPTLLARRVSKDVPAPAEDVLAVVKMLVSMLQGAEVFGHEPGEFAKLIVNIVRSDESFDEPKRGWDKVAVDLTTLLECEKPLGITAKALGVMVAHDNVYHRSSMLTDIRPVFTDDPEAPPAAATIIHNLRLSFRGNNGEEDLFIAMDEHDLDDLIQTLQRAQQKETSLRKVLTTTSIPVLVMTDEVD